MQKNAPDFIGIGADHAGLGIITELLAAHPGVSDAVPSCRFFNKSEYHPEQLDAYEAQLPPVKKGQLRGECSVEYLSSPQAAERIVAAYPTTKLFVVVREPLERAIAVYEHARRIGRVKASVTCAQYLVDHPVVQNEGFYGHHLSAYFAYYTSLQLHVIVYEDFVQDPLNVLQGLYAFLELPKDFVPKALAAYAPPPEEPKHPGRIYRLIRFIKTTVKKMKKKPFVPIVPAPFVHSQYFTAAELVAFRAAYRADVDYMTNLLHRDMGVFWGLRDLGE